ncbi:DNA-binding protein [Acinetobacter sp. ANC 4779]|uniref:Rha family transcriptional regulator n=1 Tax=Acinetobacter sp. ANC 4779 TaxID=2529848 RepID=UPI00103CE240|nr:phage antirepressor KilAC domain-containing protein [Acinetobacter sp. ANC 4779]TCB52660.1 DNA-binding protein [Acinetobacter sp. ANC 4779]
MNMPTQFASNQKKTMSTRVIADLCEKKPQHVKRDCENMFISLGLDASRFGHIYFDSMNRQQTEYLLDEELTMTLVTGYNIVLRNRVIKRWKELENYTKSVITQFQIPTSLSEALQLAADQARKIEQDKPKVNYYEKIVVRDTLLNATQVAQKLSISAISLNKHLEELDVYNRSIKRCRAFQQWFVDQELGLLKQTELGYSQPMFTLKGEAWVIEKLVSEGAIS